MVNEYRPESSRGCERSEMRLIANQRGFLSEIIKKSWVNSGNSCTTY